MEGGGYGWGRVVRLDDWGGCFDWKGGLGVGVLFVK